MLKSKCKQVKDGLIAIITLLEHNWIMERTRCDVVQRRKYFVNSGRDFTADSTWMTNFLSALVANFGTIKPTYCNSKSSSQSPYIGSICGKIAARLKLQAYFH